jgi:hypothetical protein
MKYSKHKLGKVKLVLELRLVPWQLKHIKESYRSGGLKKHAVSIQNAAKAEFIVLHVNKVRKINVLYGDRGLPSDCFWSLRLLIGFGTKFLIHLGHYIES